MLTVVKIEYLVFFRILFLHNVNIFDFTLTNVNVELEFYSVALS